MWVSAALWCLLAATMVTRYRRTLRAGGVALLLVASLNLLFAYPSCDDVPWFVLFCIDRNR
jgi:hypothetical protein